MDDDEPTTGVVNQLIWIQTSRCRECQKCQNSSIDFSEPMVDIKHFALFSVISLIHQDPFESPSSLHRIGYSAFMGSVLKAMIIPVSVQISGLFWFCVPEIGSAFVHLYLNSLLFWLNPCELQVHELFMQSRSIDSP
jgi:hypothetical protein